MYKYSSELIDIFKQIRDMPKFNAFRYKLIVDESPKGIYCPFAIQTHRLSLNDDKQLREYLVGLRDRISGVLDREVPPLNIELE